MIKWCFKYIFILLISIGLAFLTYDIVNIKDIAPIISTLQNISAAVFTLAGIWIAYMYPEAISVLTNSDNVSLLKSGDHTKRIKSLVLVIFSSAFVLICTLIFNLSAFLFIKHSAVINNKDLFKILSITYVCFISLVQIKAISTIMINNIKFVDRLYRLETEKSVNEDL